MTRYSLRFLMLLITALCILIATVRLLSPWGRIWILITAFPLVSCTCFAFSAKHVDVMPKRIMLGLVLFASAILFALGSFPTTYYLAGLPFFLVAWVGINLIWMILSLSTLRQTEEFKPKRSIKTDIALMAIPFLVIFSLAYQVPLRIVSFIPLTMLENKLSKMEAAPKGTMLCGPYLLSTPAERRGKRLCFHFAGNPDSYFVYFPKPVIPSEPQPTVGRNPGSEGHLFGYWYWVQDD